jgi:quinol monooxygenase YgiN
MVEKNVTVLAKFKAKSGMQAELKIVLVDLATKARDDQGCLVFKVLQAMEDPTLFIYHEVWATKADLDNHLAMPYLAFYREKRAPLLDGNPEVVRWNVIG